MTAPHARDVQDLSLGSVVERMTTIEARAVVVGDSIHDSSASHRAFQWARVTSVEVRPADAGGYVVIATAHGWSTCKHPREAVAVMRAVAVDCGHDEGGSDPAACGRCVAESLSPPWCDACEHEIGARIPAVFETGGGAQAVSRFCAPCRLESDREAAALGLPAAVWSAVRS